MTRSYKKGSHHNFVYFASSIKNSTMKLLASSLLLFASASILTLTSAQSTGECNLSDCPTPTCADPKTIEGDCCPSCENSSCNFRGCVHYGAFGAEWRPDPCTVCHCANEEEVCAKIMCDEPQCFGYPKKSLPDSCCPVCDWGIAEDDCRPIPVAQKSLYVAMGDYRQCQTDVTVHECDKRFVQKDGRLYRCKPRRRNQIAQMQSCREVRKVVYHDIKKCILQEMNDIPLDFDPAPNTCQFRV